MSLTSSSSSLSSLSSSSFPQYIPFSCWIGYFFQAWQLFGVQLLFVNFPNYVFWFPNYKLSATAISIPFCQYLSVLSNDILSFSHLICLSATAKNKQNSSTINFVTISQFLRRYFFLFYFISFFLLNFYFTLLYLF